MFREAKKWHTLVGILVSNLQMQHLEIYARQDYVPHRKGNSRFWWGLIGGGGGGGTETT